MKFKTKKFRVKNILKKTSAKGFKDLKIGDEVFFFMELVYTVKGSRPGNYALGVTIVSPYNSWQNTQNKFLINLSNFELEEVIII